MPTRIYFPDGQKVDVKESPNEVFARLNENGGLPVRFDAPWGDDTKTTYVNPSRITYFEDVTPSRAPAVAYVGS